MGNALVMPLRWRRRRRKHAPLQPLRCSHGSKFAQQRGRGVGAHKFARVRSRSRGSGETTPVTGGKNGIGFTPEINAFRADQAYLEVTADHHVQVRRGGQHVRAPA